ncbi:hypothetical protein CDD82_5345 [Ophiocordyceps australis]|uniref:GTP:AMP phosphotransferase, mitochondrial n=1 Tax=Ophiocordyceps australis TaxID=1399860 RepID=A0A2C5Y417_9HYPO|nr:hypothetical protein CDD82_5345 [Ophiocordyceps australis]
MQLRRAARVILIGAPGVGKGTQTDRLLNRFSQLQSISTGDVLRRNVKNRTPLGIMAENTIKTGGLVADDLMLRLISAELRSRGWLSGPSMTLSSAATSAEPCPPAPPPPSLEAAQALHSWPVAHNDDPSASFILDGYPRTAAQAATLDALVPINLAVSLKTPFSVILSRIASRWVHEPSGRVYNAAFNAPRIPGRDDITGEPLVQRADDQEHVYRARFARFEQASEPLLEHYARRGVLLEIEGMSSDEISPRLYSEFQRRFAL